MCESVFVDALALCQPEESSKEKVVSELGRCSFRVVPSKLTLSLHFKRNSIFIETVDMQCSVKLIQCGCLWQQVSKNYSFLDYIFGGLQINFTVKFFSNVNFSRLVDSNPILEMLVCVLD